MNCVSRILAGLCLSLVGLLGLAPPAQATCVASSGVNSSVTPSGLSFLYQFDVTNGCSHPQAMLSNFFLPYFNDAGISNIVVPGGWSYVIDTSNNLFGLTNAGVIAFTSGTPLGYSFTDGFSYTANFGGVKGPFAMSLTTNGVGSTLFGDPLIPGSPETLAALGASGVPEPSSITLLGAGMIGLVGFAKRRVGRTRVPTDSEGRLRAAETGRSSG